MNFSGLYEMQGMLFSLMLLGAFLRRRGIITEEGKRVIADLVLYVTLPCSILKSFEMEFNMSIMRSSAEIFFISCLVQGACAVLNLFLYRGVEERKKKVLLYGTMSSNGGILGNPIAEGIFGPIGLFYASIYLIPMRTMMWSIGMAYFTECPDRKTLIKKVCTHPCIVSVFAGFVMMLLQVRIPGFAGATVGSLGNANTAMSMIFVGTILGSANFSTLVTPVTCYYAVIRLVLIPAMTLLGCRMMGAETVVTGVSVVLSGMPAASAIALLAAKYNGDELFATKCVVFTTVLSMVTVPLWCMVL